MQCNACCCSRACLTMPQLPAVSFSSVQSSEISDVASACATKAATARYPTLSLRCTPCASPHSSPAATANCSCFPSATCAPPPAQKKAMLQRFHAIRGASLVTGCSLGYAAIGSAALRMSDSAVVRVLHAAESAQVGRACCSRCGPRDAAGQRCDCCSWARCAGGQVKQQQQQQQLLLLQIFSFAVYLIKRSKSVK